jgi:hypothetical protein
VKVQSDKAKRFILVSLIVLGLVPAASPRANAAITWSQYSSLDVVYDGKFYNAQFDLQYSSAAIFDNSKPQM